MAPGVAGNNPAVNAGQASAGGHNAVQPPHLLGGNNDSQFDEHVFGGDPGLSLVEHVFGGPRPPLYPEHEDVRIPILREYSRRLGILTSLVRLQADLMQAAEDACAENRFRFPTAEGSRRFLDDLRRFLDDLMRRDLVAHVRVLQEERNGGGGAVGGGHDNPAATAPAAGGHDNPVGPHEGSSLPNLFGAGAVGRRGPARSGSVDKLI